MIWLLYLFCGWFIVCAFDGFDGSDRFTDHWRVLGQLVCCWRLVLGFFVGKLLEEVFFVKGDLLFLLGVQRLEVLIVFLEAVAAVDVLGLLGVGRFFLLVLAHA